jgi:hypothetical protein
MYRNIAARHSHVCLQCVLTYRSVFLIYHTRALGGSAEVSHPEAHLAGTQGLVARPQ